MSGIMERRFTTPQRRALWHLRRAEIEWGPFCVWDKGRVFCVKYGTPLCVRRDVVRRLIDLGGIERHSDHPNVNQDIYRVAEWARAHADLAFTSYAAFNKDADPAAPKKA